MPNDGNTALPVSPVTKEDAMNISAMLSKMANAVVAASTMPQTIEQLEQELSSLRQRFESAQQHGQELDNALREMREQRDRAEQELSQTKARNDALAETNRQLTGEGILQRNEIDRLDEDVRNLKRELENAQLAAMQAEDERDQARKALHDIRERVSAMFPEPIKPEPEPVPAPANPPTTSEGWDHLPPAEPEPTPDVPRYEDQRPSANRW